MALSNAQWFANPGVTYEIDQSCRFDGTSSYLTKTFASAGNLKTWTQSFWMKRSTKSGTANEWFLNTADGGNTGSRLHNNTTTGTLEWMHGVGGGYNNRNTTQVFLDYSAWYHIVIQLDTTQASEPNRSKLWVNGEQVTAFSTAQAIAEDATTYINDDEYEHGIGRNEYDNNQYFSGYLAEFIFIDGTALEADSFGETNSTTGQWIPKDPSSLTFGSNGFWLDFADSTFLGKDASATSAAVTNKASTSSEWGGTTGAYTFATNEIDRSSTVNAIISTDLLSGDFNFNFTLTTSGGAVRIGVFDNQESNTFDGTSDDGGLDSMTNSWYLDMGNEQFRYGGASQGSASGVANGSAITIQRTGSTIKITDDGSDAHTFSQTFSNPVRVIISGGGAAFALDSVQYTADEASGNDNSFFSSGLAAADQMTDSPTNNHATLNPIQGPHTAINVYSLSDGNLVTNATGDTRGYGTIPFDVEDADGFYWEAKMTSAATYPNIAIRSVAAVNNESGDPSATGRYNFIGSDGNFSQPSGSASYGDAWAGTANIVLGVLAKAGSLYFSIDGTVQNSGTAAITGLTGHYIPLVFTDAGGGTPPSWEMRFAANMWSTTPSGYKAICTANLPDPTIADPSAYFQTTLYTGNGSTQSIDQGGNSTFEPDFVWLKNRDAADNHCVFDSVRGATKVIFTNNADVQTTDADTLTSFDSDGFSLGDDDKVNTNTEKYVGWQWLESNTPALDIVQYEGTGSKQTISHGLGVAPDLIIFKNIDSAQGWAVYHRPLGPEYEIRLSTATAAIDDAAFYDDDNPTSSVFTVNTNSAVNGSGNTIIAYVFAEVEGFSKVGKYTGNGNADGPFVWCGFRPSFLLWKNSNTADDWNILDDQRSPYNVADLVLEPDTADAEVTGSPREVDLLSNGFKIRGSDTNLNGDGNTHIFWACAETPFKTANAR